MSVMSPDTASEKLGLVKTSMRLHLRLSVGQRCLRQKSYSRAAYPDFTMADIHCHILANVDDGSQSCEMTAMSCRFAADDGIRHILAIPQCNHGFG